MTYLEIVNRVLRRLRENEVTDVDQTDYSRMIGDLVEEGLATVTEAYDWSLLRRSLFANVTAGDNGVLLATDTESGDLFTGGTTTTNAHAYIATGSDGQSGVWLFNVAHNTTPSAAAGDAIGKRLIPMSGIQRQDWFMTDVDYEAEPTHYYVRIQATGGAAPGKLFLRLYPTPPEDCVIRAEVCIPVLEIDDFTDTVELPWRPIFAYAYMRALNERGEELGEPGNLAERTYLDALGAAIEADIGSNKWTNEYEFFRN